MRTLLLILFCALQAGGAIVNWTNTPNQWPYSSGDTVRLWGKFETAFVITNSGTVGNPTTFQFQPGCYFTRSNWYDGGQSAAIYGSGLSYVNINGQGVGYIEATNNGTALAYQVDNTGFKCAGCNNITVSGLLTSNLYVRTPDSTNDANSFGTGVRFTGSTSDIVINQCTNSYSATGFQIQYRVGNSNFVISSNYARHFVIAAVVGSETGGSTLTNVQIFNNDFAEGRAFSGHPDLHFNCIHVYSVQSGNSLTGVRVYNNYFHGDWGAYNTSLAFIEGYFTEPWVYNNVFHTEGTIGGGNGMLVFKQGSKAKVFNNTFVGFTNGTEGAFNAIKYTTWVGTETDSVVTNNLFFWCNFAVYDTPYTTITASDNNLFYPNTTLFRAVSGGSKDFAAWQAAGFDASGTTNRPVFASAYTLDSADTAAIGQGVNLTALGITTDRFGNARPSSGAWTIGAVEGGEEPPAPSSVTRSIRTGKRSATGKVVWQ